MKIQFLFVVAVLSTPVFAQQGKTLEQVNREADYKKAMVAADTAIAALNEITLKNELACEKAVGNPKFCECLSQKLPYIFNFNQYVAIVTQTKEQNGYNNLSADQKRAYNMIPSVRDQCVSAQ